MHKNNKPIRTQMTKTPKITIKHNQTAKGSPPFEMKAIHLKFRDGSRADLVPFRSVHVGKLNGLFQHPSRRRPKSKKKIKESLTNQLLPPLLSSVTDSQVSPLNLAFFVLSKMGSQKMRFKGAGRRDSRFSRGDNPRPYR